MNTQILMETRRRIVTGKPCIINCSSFMLLKYVIVLQKNFSGTNGEATCCPKSVPCCTRMREILL